MGEETLIQQLVDEGILCDYCNQPEDCMRCKCDFAWQRYLSIMETKLRDEAEIAPLDDNDPLLIPLPAYTQKSTEEDYEWGFGYGDEVEFK